MYQRIFPVDRSWTLFLDRDGVINERLEGDYVKSIEEFHFLPGVIDAVVQLSRHFGKIIVVTNQQGIGKGIYSHEDLAGIHALMTATIANAGGTIDAVYYAPQLQGENSPMRKPGIGMALAAKEKFPAIDFRKSIMVGDTSSDMEFARNAGMRTVFCCAGNEKVNADLRVASLEEFASYISGSKS